MLCPFPFSTEPNAAPSNVRNVNTTSTNIVVQWNQVQLSMPLVLNVFVFSLSLQSQMPLLKTFVNLTQALLVLFFNGT